MERQTQLQGVRKWYGGAWIKLQDQIYKAIEEGLLGGFSNIIVSGCSVTPNGANYDVSAGIVMINGVLHISEAIENTTLPVYLTSNPSTLDRPYSDAINKAVENHFYTASATVDPGGNRVKVANDTTSRLLKPFIAENGDLSGLPKTDSYQIDSSNLLATAKALKLLNDVVSQVKTKTDKMGNAYFKYVSTSLNNYPIGTPVPFELAVGAIAQPANSLVTVPAGGILRIDVVQGLPGSGLEMLINGNTTVALSSGRNIYQNTSLGIQGCQFVHKDASIDIEIEVIQLG